MDTEKNFVQKFASYFVVGLLATFVEWGFYYLFDPVLHLNTYVAVALSFVFSTFANWAFGRLLTFKNAENQGLLKELAAIYGASVIGLLLNEIIMYVLLSFVFPDSSFYKMAAKIIATGIVFFWNFLIRDLVIYKDKK